MKRTVLLSWMVLALFLVASPLRSDTLEDIDQAVNQIGAFLRDLVPEEQGLNLTVLPFPSDRHGPVVLGDRLKSELELYLAARYRKTRIVSQPEGLNSYVVSGELQSYPDRVRIVCRITRPDGSLGGGIRVDIPVSPGLQSLLVPAAADQPGSAPREGLSLGPPGAAPGGAPAARADGDDATLRDGDDATLRDDAFEPDDSPGFEVELPAGDRTGPLLFQRFITAGDIDRFRFYNSRKGTVVLEARTDLDLQLLLYREGENIPFAVHGNRGSQALRLETVLSEGYYIVELLAFDFQAEGAYTFSVDLDGRSNDGFEPDNSFSEAKAILPETSQDRVLLSGDQDWVELSFKLPGFYALYTQGVEADTLITVFSDEEREIVRDDDSGQQSNAYVALFLGTRRSFARITAKGALASGSYTLSLRKIEPRQIYPGAGIQQVEITELPLAYQLRIIQPGQYLIRAKGMGGIPFGGTSPPAVGVELFSLPAMRATPGSRSAYSLSSGDYLLLLKSEQPQTVRFCAAPASEAGPCLQEMGE